jgi:hypothetical protein
VTTGRPGIPDLRRVSCVNFATQNGTAGRPGVLAASDSTAPDSGHSANSSSVRSIDAEVMYIVLRPGPPKVMLLGHRTGTGTVSATAPPEVNRVT